MAYNLFIFRYHVFHSMSIISLHIFGIVGTLRKDVHST